MGQLYTVSLQQPDANASFISNTISFGDRRMQIDFQWAIASEEQYNMVAAWISRQASTDPLIEGDTFITDYDWLAFYLNLSGMTDAQLESWLSTADKLPRSLTLGDMYSRVITAKRRIEECVSLDPVVRQYKEVMRWQFKAVYDNETTVGAVEVGGWYRHQDPSMSFRFTSKLDYIGKADLGNVTMEIEVFDA